VTAEDAYAVLLRFEGGGLGILSLVSTARHDRGDVIELHGEDGTVTLDADQRLWWGRAGEELHCEGPFDNSSKAAFERLARSFWAAIRKGEPPETPLDEGLRVQAVFDAVRTAALEGRWVQPEPVAAASSP
jgi:predicted dehydrogenase